jgi:periplasmic copper chaperone A
MTGLAWKYSSRGFAAAFALTMTQLSAVTAQAADYDVGSIHIAQPWARATPKGATAAAGYMTITNKGTSPDRVNCVSSDASAQCQIHTMTMDNGVMKMRPVEGGLEIKPGETVTLKPGGLHVMFIDLKHPFVQGKTVEATLKFDNAGTIEVDYPVAAVGAGGPPGAAAAGDGMNMDKPGGMMMKPH